MDFIKGLRGLMGAGTELNALWNVPETTEEIDSLFMHGAGISIIYKHSYSCSVSVFAKSRVETILEHASPKATFYFVDVRQNRPVSNYIAEKSGIRHESPQLLIIQKGDVVWHGSHHQVTAEAVTGFLNEV